MKTNGYEKGHDRQKKSPNTQQMGYDLRVMKENSYIKGRVRQEEILARSRRTSGFGLCKPTDVNLKVIARLRG